MIEDHMVGLPSSIKQGGGIEFLRRAADNCGLRVNWSLKPEMEPGSCLWIACLLLMTTVVLSVPRCAVNDNPADCNGTISSLFSGLTFLLNSATRALQHNRPAAARAVGR